MGLRLVDPAGRTRMVVTIDGPAGSGKSTTAREVARRLGFRHLDSGALYRALTLALLRAEIPEPQWGSLDAEVLDALDIRLDPDDVGFKVVLPNGASEPELRSPEVTRLVPRLAGVRAARDRLALLQRSALAHGGLVADGRDMGTVVFPDAILKVFLTASLEERARRRLMQHGEDPTPIAIASEAERIGDRDAADSDREVAPLRQAPGALVIDTTALSFEEQVERILLAANAKFDVGSGSGIE